MSKQNINVKILDSSGNIISVPKPNRNSKKLDLVCPYCKQKTIHYNIIPDGKKQIYLFMCLNECEFSTMTYIGNKEQALSTYYSRNFILKNTFC